MGPARGLAPLLSAALAAALPAPAGAVSPRFLEDTTAEDFAQGEARGVVVRPEGSLAVGRATTRIALAEANAWSLLATPTGEAYVGTGVHGAIARVVGDRAERVYETGELAVTCMVEAGGAIYAGTIPNGRVFRISPEGGIAELVRLPTPYVWRLVAQDASTLWAATGDEGRLYRIAIGADGTGRAELAATAPDRNVVALLALAGGEVLAGTAPQGLVLRRRPGADGFEALASFGDAEVKALAPRAGGGLLVALNRMADVSGSVEDLATHAHILAKDPGSGRARTALVGSLWALGPAGGAEPLWEGGKDFIVDLAAGADGTAWLATGNRGRVVAVDTDGQALTAFDFEESQVQALLLDPEGQPWLAGTGNGGALYRVEAGPAESPGFDSRVLDAGFPARWGRLWVEATGPVRARARAGNTPRPDATWTAWGEPLEDFPAPAGVGEGPWRYLQYRAELVSPESRVDSVRAACLPANQRPRVTSVAVEPTPPAEGDAADGGAGAGRLRLRKLSWVAESPDGDELEYEVWLRREGDETWRRLDRTPHRRETELVWDSLSVPDGRYELRVVATDAPANPADRALTAQRTSLPFLVDNGRPEIRDLGFKDGRLRATVVDAASAVSRIEVSLDGEEWLPVYPEDLILDDTTERLDWFLPVGLPPGPHFISVRAADEAGNAVVARLDFRVE
ncbi:MAG: hypothetical protein HY722_09320 [Planctomycetes bacterium]|nr:hypothetical protein [Planctomycetota bacterium]